jgi:hypothetical protein
MSLQVTGQAQGVVLVASQKSGAPAAVSTGWHNELIKSDLLPRYGYLALSGVVFSAATVTGVALAALGTNSPIFTLWNPINSGKNLLLIDVSWGITAVTFAAADVTVTLGVGANVTAAPTTTTPIVGVNNLVGNGNKPQAFTYSQATLAAAPTASRHLGTVTLDTATTVAGIANPAYIKDEIAGALIIGPGSLAAIGGEGTPADITIVVAMTWAELPI